MKKDIFGNQANPFTVPDGYFDTLQERIMSRIEAEYKSYACLDEVVPRPEYDDRFNLSSYIRTRLYLVRTRSNVRTLNIRTMLAAAACVLFIFTGATLYMRYSEPQFVIAGSVPDEDFFQWLYASDEATLLVESLDMAMPDGFLFSETGYSEEDEAIISFLERDNIIVAAILHSIDNETFFTP